MATIPIFLKHDPARPCLVVGGGTVARRKVDWLLDCGARIQVISPEFSPSLAQLARELPRELTLRQEPYATRDLAPYQLAIAATGDAEVNRLVAADARRAGIPVNVVDRPELCSFYVPATVHRGDLQLAVGTGGACPTLAARLRRELDDQYPGWYETYTAVLGEVRQAILRDVADPDLRAALMDHLASREIAESLQNMDLHEMTEALLHAAQSWFAGQ